MVILLVRFHPMLPSCDGMACRQVLLSTTFQIILGTDGFKEHEADQVSDIRAPVSLVVVSSKPRGAFYYFLSSYQPYLPLGCVSSTTGAAVIEEALCFS